MSRNTPTPDHQRPGHMPASASPAPGSADLIHRRQLEKSVSWSGRERLRCLWYRLRLELADVNYASRRVVELQIPWIADPQWHTKTGPPPPRRSAVTGRPAHPGKLSVTRHSPPIPGSTMTGAKGDRTTLAVALPEVAATYFEAWTRKDIAAVRPLLDPDANRFGSL